MDIKNGMEDTTPTDMNIATLKSLRVSIKKLEMCKDSFSDLIECAKIQFNEIEKNIIRNHLSR